MLTNSDTFDTFQYKLRGEFGSRLFAKYKDADGDLVTIRNERDVKMMYNYAQKVRLTLILYSVRPARDEDEGTAAKNYKRKDFKKHMVEKREKRRGEQREREREREREEKEREKGREKEKEKEKEKRERKEKPHTSRRRKDADRDTDDKARREKRKRERCERRMAQSRATTKKRNNANFSTFEVLESFVDAVVTIDHRGIVLFFNGAAEDMFGWDREEILGKNANLLMNDNDAKAHGGYLRRYRQRGKGGIMGKGKKVKAKAKGGRLFDVWLSLSETNVSYTAIIQEIQEGMRVMPMGGSTASSSMDLGELFSFFDMYTEAVVVMLESGIIQYANKKVYSTFGHENLVGAPASIICPALCSSKVCFLF